MAVAFDAVASGSIAGGAFPLTWTHTPVGVPTAVSVTLQNYEGFASITGVTYGGFAMTMALSQDFVSSSKLQIWGLVNPPSGAQTVSITGSAGTGYVIAGSTTVTGSDTTTCFRNTFSQTFLAGTTSYSGTVNSVVSGDFAVSQEANFDGITRSYTPGTGVTKHWGDIGAGAFCGAGGYKAVTGTSVTMAWTIAVGNSADNNAAQAIGVFQQAGAAAGLPPGEQLTQYLSIGPPRIDQTWTSRQTNMIGQDRLPFRQCDWPNPTPPSRLDQTWIRRQTGMIGQDRLPFRQQDWPNPIPPPPGQSWTWRQTGMIGQDRLPFRQMDWPNPIPPPEPGRTWLRSQTGMIGQDRLPFRQQDWPNPTQPPRLDATWVQGFNPSLATVVVVFPFRQQDWPNPIQPPRLDQTWTQGFNVNLATIVTFPFRQTNWPNPTQPNRIDQTWTWRQTGMEGQDQLPFRQQDWPNPTQPPPGQSWTWRQTNMLGQDRLPFRQMDWPLPALHMLPRIDPAFISGFTMVLEGSIINFVPHNQFDWPNPLGHQMLFQPDRAFVSPPGINLIPPPPPPLVTAVHSPHFFSTMGMSVGSPANPSS